LWTPKTESGTLKPDFGLSGITISVSDWSVRPDQGRVNAK
jgi:hypothetical protein